MVGLTEMAMDMLPSDGGDRVLKIGVVDADGQLLAEAKLAFGVTSGH